MLDVTEGNESNKSDKVDESTESKPEAVSIEEIREAIGNNVSSTQKRAVIKDIVINLVAAVFMVFYLILIMVGSDNIVADTLYKDMKIIALFIMAAGIFTLEVAYKRDNSKIAMNGIETLVFGAVNVCLIYIAKLYTSNLVRFTTYIGIAVGTYYTLKCIALSIISTRKFRKDNSDIKDIIQKKNKDEV